MRRVVPCPERRQGTDANLLREVPQGGPHDRNGRTDAAKEKRRQGALLKRRRPCGTAAAPARGRTGAARGVGVRAHRLARSEQNVGERQVRFRRSWNLQERTRRRYPMRPVGVGEVHRGGDAGSVPPGVARRALNQVVQDLPMRTAGSPIHGFISPIARRAGDAEIARPETRSVCTRGALKSNGQHGFLAMLIHCMEAASATRRVGRSSDRAGAAFVSISMTWREGERHPRSKKPKQYDYPSLLGGGASHPSIIQLQNRPVGRSPNTKGRMRWRNM